MSCTKAAIAMQRAEEETFKGLSKEVQAILRSVKCEVRDRAGDAICGLACKDGSACRRKPSKRLTKDGIAVQACSTHAEAARYNALLTKHCDAQIAVERELYAKKLEAARMKYMRLLRERDEACEARIADLKRHHETLGKAGSGKKKPVTKKTRRSTRRKR